MGESKLFKWLLPLCLVVVFFVTTGQVIMNPPTHGMFPLKVSSGVLQTAGGTPYMVLADAPQGANAIPLCTAGNTYALCQNSTDQLPTNATFVAYARNRQAQGFNSLWINILCEPYTGCAGNGADNAGNLPFTTGLSGTGFAGGFNGTADSCSGTPADMDCWDMSTAGTGASATYWTHIDGYFKVAAQFGMQIIANPLPIDACGNHAGSGQSIGFMYLNNYQLHPGQANGTATMNAFADFLYARYGNPTSGNYAPNLIWMVGNDYQCWDPVAYSNQLVSGADAVFYAFTSRLHADEAGGGHHLIFTETDGAVTASLVDQVSTWQNVMDLDGLYSGAGPMYDVALSGLAQATALSLSPPPPGIVVEASYQGEDNNANKYDGTATGTNISGCGDSNLNVSSGGDPNKCPYAERAQFWQSVLGGSFAGYLDGNHYSWPFLTGWNNGTGMASGTCSGTSGTGHSPCLDTVANANLKNAVAFLNANIAWYKLVPDETRSTDANGVGFGVSVTSPLVSNGTANDGCYPANACTNYYIGSNRAGSGSSGSGFGNSGGQLQNRMPVGGVTSDGKSGIVYLGGINTSCGYSITNRVYTSCVPASGLQITVNNAVLNTQLTAAWYDPSGPMTSPSSIVCSPSTTPCNSGSQVYTTPASGHTDANAADWVLLLTTTGVSGGQTPSSIAIGGDGCSGAACSVPNIDSTFANNVTSGLPPSGTYIGTLSTTLSAGTPPFSGSYSLVAHVTGDNCGTGTINNAPFQISSDQLQYNSGATAGTTYNVCVKATVGANSTTQEFTVNVHNVQNISTVSGCTGAGTSASPWGYLCLQNAFNNASNGDTLFVPAGNVQLNTATTDPAQVSFHGKQINFIGAGSSNTFDTWGHISNGSGAVTCPTSSSSVTCIYSAGTSYPPGGGSTPNPAAHVVFGDTLQQQPPMDTGCVNINIAHAFFDASRAENGDDGLLVVRECVGPTLIKDIRFLAYAGTTSAETQLVDHLSPSVVLADSLIGEAQSGISGGNYPSNFVFEPVSGNGINMTNDLFFQFWPIPTSNSNAILNDTAIMLYNDGLATQPQDAYYGPTGTQPGGTTSVYCPEVTTSNGECPGNTTINSTNNLLWTDTSRGFSIGGGVNDFGTNGGLVNLNVTGNWIRAGTADIDACVWNIFSDQSNCTGGQSMTLNTLVDTSCNESNNGTPFNITNNSLIGTSVAEIDMIGQGLVGGGVPCRNLSLPTSTMCNGVIPQSQCISAVVYGVNAQQNYLSSSSNQYITNANTFSPTQTANYCNGTIGTWSGGSTCNTSGFTNSPTASFSLGNLHYDPTKGANVVAVLSPTFTAQYGAVQWLAVDCASPCSTPPTAPSSSDSRWSSNNSNFPKATSGSSNGVVSATNSYIPPAALAAAHGDTVYMWVMDSVNHISSTTPQAIP